MEPPSSWGAVNALVEAADALLALDRLDEAAGHASAAASVAVRLDISSKVVARRTAAWRGARLQGKTRRLPLACLLEQLAVFHRPDGMLDHYLETTYTAGLAAAMAGNSSPGMGAGGRPVNGGFAEDLAR